MIIQGNTSNMYLLVRLVFLICVLAGSVTPLRFMIRPGTGKKCVKEEIHKNVLVTGEYELTDAPGQKASIQVTDSKNHVLYQKDAITKGKFAFTTEEYEMFDVCITTEMVGGGGGGQEREVSLTIKHGVETKSYDGLAQAEKLKPLELELKRLEDLSDSIVKDFQYMREREEKMRDTNESTHSRILYFSFFSILCLFGLATWQVFYLRRYFKSKKLIE